MEPEPLSYSIPNFLAKTIKSNLNYLGIKEDKVINWYNRQFKCCENITRNLKLDIINFFSDSEDSRLVIIAKELRKSL